MSTTSPRLIAFGEIHVAEQIVSAATPRLMVVVDGEYSMRCSAGKSKPRYSVLNKENDLVANQPIAPQLMALFSRTTSIGLPSSSPSS